MKFLSLPVLAFLVLMLPVAGNGANAGLFTIVTPPDRSFVEGGLISIVLKAPKNSLDEVRIAVNSNNNLSFKRTVDRGHVCCEGIDLDRGMNQLTVTVLNKGEVIEERKLTVFFRSALSAKASSAPSGFKRYIFHLPVQEKVCEDCHQVKLSLTDGNPSAPRESRCFICHKKKTVGKFVHPPAAEWACVACHNGKGEQGGGALAADDTSCAGCHGHVLAKWRSKMFMHGPSDAGHCTACHNPHASDQRDYLHLNATEICVTCHEDFMSKPHVVTGVSSKEGHPFNISPDPYRPGRDFTCASCHNPHAGDAPNFLNNYKPSMSIHYFCLSCHKI